jgi:phosphoribosylanthranilate isomerase
VAAAVQQLHPWAVDVSTGVEVSDADGQPRKGIKSATKIIAFIREVRRADG